jgi:hypothetical protein
MKTTELEGPALDWAVAKCEGFPVGRDVAKWVAGPDDSGDYEPNYDYSTDWAQGGPIIERERIDIWRNEPCWSASRGVVIRGIDGATPLIAAMRCYVASKLGAEVEVPDELKEEK